jgi:hypothetical protein
MKSILFRVLTVVGLLVCLEFAGFAQGGNTYILPGTTINDNITVGNLTNAPTTATISFYDSSGKLNSLSVPLPPGTQTRVNATSVALSSFAGTVVVTSPTPLTVSADRFEGNTSFDFLYPTQVASTLVIPYLPAGAATDVNVFNPGPNQAEVKVVLMQPSGAHTDSRTATVDPLHTATISIPSSSAVAYAFVVTANILRPDSPVAANAVIRTWNPQASGAVARTDFAVVPAVPVNQFSPTATVPFFAQGPDYFSKVHVANLSSSQQTVSILATRSDGTPMQGTNNPASVVLPGYGSTDQEMASLFGSSAATSLFSGTITVTSEGSATTSGPTNGPKVPLTATVSIGNISEPSLAVMPSGIAPQTVFAFQLRGTGREFFTGLSFQNTGTSDANLSIAFVLDAGATISTIPYKVAKGQQQIAALSDLFPEAVGNGVILVKSDVPIIATGLDGRSDNSALALRLPVFADPSFAPPPQSSFAVVGTVRDASVGVNGQNIGVPDVAFSLSGPVNATTATDAAGTFTFQGLPPGRYQLTPLPVSYTVSPGGNTIVITNQNSRGNDFQIGLTTPTITQINPASALTTTTGSTTPVGITVQGTNFTQPTTFSGNIFTGNINKFTTGTVLVFAASQVPTTVTNPAFLQASVPPSLLVTTGTVQVTIRNLGPSGDFIDSAPVSFLVGSAAPTLTTVTGQPTPIIVNAITQPFQVTVNGSGFTPATLVRVNFVGRPTTYVNQNQVIGTVLPSDLTLAGFVPITVQNPNSVDSNAFQLPVLYPIPVISQISPSSLIAPVALNAPPVQVTITGTNFSQNPNNLLDFATALVNGSPVPTQYVSSTTVVAVIPASIAATPGILQLAVQNPLPNLAPSNAQALFVQNPAPVITSLDAGNVSFNPNSGPNTFFSATVVITGTNFAPNAQGWVNVPCDTLGLRKTLTTVRNSSTQVVVTFRIQCAGAYKVQVENPQPGGGLSVPPAVLNVPSVSASLSPVITSSALPVITSVDATKVGFNASAGTVDQPVAITGNNFSPNAQVWVNVSCDDLGFRKASSSTAISPTQVSATISVGCAGTYQIEVENPELGGGLSAPSPLVVPRVGSAGIINRMILPTRQTVD